MEDSSSGIQNLTETIAALSTQDAPIQLISDDAEIYKDSNNNDFHPINSLVWQIVPTSNKKGASYVLTILSSFDKVDVTALRQSILQQQSIIDFESLQSGVLRLAASTAVAKLCGYAAGTVPPLIGLTPPPILTLVEESLQTSTQQKFKGGGGTDDQSCVITLDWLLTQPNVKLASFRKMPLATTEDTPVPAEPSPTTFPNVLDIKPFFAVAPPSKDVVRYVLLQPRNGRKRTSKQAKNNKDDPSSNNPLQPVAVSVVGRLSGVRRMAKTLVFGDLAPVSGQHTSMDHPWRSPGMDAIDMAVQLIVGQTYCQRHGSEAENNLKQLQVGQLVLVQGRTNVQNRESLKNWMQNDCLDLVVSEFSILHSESEQPDSLWRPLPNLQTTQGTRASHSSVLGTLHRPPSSAPEEPGMSFLTLQDLYGRHASNDNIQVVSTLSDIHYFTNRLQHLHERITERAPSNENADKSSSGPVTLVGVDCEWKPNFLRSSSNDPQPVLLLQVSLHELQEVYLFDLQTLVRPLLAKNHERNDEEEALVHVMETLLSSKHFVKVGFGIMNDLRRLAASYPHIQSFQEVQAVLEASILGKKVMRLSKQKNARIVTSSLKRLTERFVQRTINKEQQCSDWSIRPLTQKQKDYAALDAAVTPVIAERLLSKVSATFNDRPQLGRWKDDTSFSDCITSWRFILVESNDERALKKVKAQRIVGSQWVVTQSWITGDESPKQPSMPIHGEGPYTDASGTLRIPSQTTSIRTDPDKFGRIVNGLVGQLVGRSKDDCVNYFLADEATLPEGSRLDFPQRSGYVEFDDAVVLFVNMPDKTGQGQPRSYPNEWLDNGKTLTWFLRESDWKGGTTRLSQKLMPQGDNDAFVVLFVRMGKGKFLCCGRCRVAEKNKDDDSSESREWDLVELHLHLLDWDALQESPDFRQLVEVDQIPADVDVDVNVDLE